MPIKTQNQRNPVARAAILRKGGVHEKCRTSKRQQQKRELEDAVSAYYLSAGSSYDNNNTEPYEVPDKLENKNRGNNSPVFNTDRGKFENNHEEINTKKAIGNSSFLSINFFLFRTAILTYLLARASRAT